MKDDLAGFYLDHIRRYETVLNTIKQKLLVTAVFRLASFAAIIYLIYRLFIQPSSLLAIASLVSLTVFLWLVKRSTTLTVAKLLNENLLYLNKNEWGIINGGKNQFGSGESERSGEAYYEDLDIFGAGSLYQLLNRTVTSYGKKTLANLLKNPLLEVDDIVAQQEALKILNTQFTERQMITAVALSIEDKQSNFSGLNTWLNQPLLYATNKWLRFARYAMPLLNIVTLIISLNLGQYYLLSLTVLLSWAHVGYVAKHTHQQTLLLGKQQEVLSAYAAILREFNKVDAENSTILTSLQEQTRNADKEIGKLAQLVNLLDQRLNLIVNLLLNSFLLYDLQCILSLEKYKISNRQNLDKWINCVGQVECLVSLSTYSFNHTENHYPTIERTKLLVTGNDVYHPLIPIDENVSNDVRIGSPAKLMLITGSNMSGKTTYLRTVGINTLMGQCGLPVCAAAFHFSPVRLFTSIRISDSLQDHTSYFMAELKRLQFIINSVQSNIPSLILIDEILRGTNSVDKYYGSEQFVKQLIQYNCLTLFATHDLKLSVLEEEYPGLIENYCFESVIEAGELNFDYKLLRGVARNKNASFLMEKMGII